MGVYFYPPTDRCSLCRRGVLNPLRHDFVQPESGHGLVVQDDATQANGVAERESALEMIDRQAPGTSNLLTLVADKAYDAREFVADLRQKCVTPHVVQKARISAIDGRTTRHAGYAVSQRKRKLVEPSGSPSPYPQSARAPSLCVPVTI
jgi:hypothetical protein